MWMMQWWSSAPCINAKHDVGRDWGRTDKVEVANIWPQLRTCDKLALPSVRMGSHARTIWWHQSILPECDHCVNALIVDCWFYRATLHIGNLLTSSRLQYFLIFSADNWLTSSSRCAQSTLPKESMISFISSILSSLFPALHSSTYASSLSMPLWISLCCVRSSNSFLNGGILCARTGKMCCSSEAIVSTGHLRKRLQRVTYQ